MNTKLIFSAGGISVVVCVRIPNEFAAKNKRQDRAELSYERGATHSVRILSEL